MCLLHRCPRDTCNDAHMHQMPATKKDVRLFAICSKRLARTTAGICRKFCMDCVLPECFRCKTRAPFPKNYVKVLGEDGAYHDCCPKCRASDLGVCSTCQTQKTVGDFRKLTRGTHAKICKECERPPCTNCGQGYPANKDPWSGKQRNAQYYCSELCKYPVCHFPGCGRDRPRHSSGRYQFFNTPVWHCELHRAKKQ